MGEGVGVDVSSGVGVGDSSGVGDGKGVSVARGDSICVACPSVVGVDILSANELAACIIIPLLTSLSEKKEPEKEMNIKG